MFRFVLPAALLVLMPFSMAFAHDDRQTPHSDPAFSGDGVGGLQAHLPPCEHMPDTGQNCVRVLACIGDQGLFFYGQARGEDVGIVLGRMSSGLQCSGRWGARKFSRRGYAKLKCEDGSRFNLNFFDRDPRTGTTITDGKDSEGRMIRAWSGANVLHFLGGTTQMPSLKCGDFMVPLPGDPHAG